MPVVYFVKSLTMGLVKIGYTAHGKLLKLPKLEKLHKSMPLYTEPQARERISNSPLLAFTSKQVKPSASNQTGNPESSEASGTSAGGAGLTESTDNQ